MEKFSIAKSSCLSPIGSASGRTDLEQAQHRCTMLSPAILSTDGSFSATYKWQVQQSLKMLALL